MAQIILDSNNNLIQGDFDNATLNNRTKLQTTTTNATTNVYVVPNGSSTSAGVSVANNSNLTNASKIVMATNGTTDTQIISGVNGSGTYLPLSFYTNNTLAAQISTAGVFSATGGIAASSMPVGSVLQVVSTTKTDTFSTTSTSFVDVTGLSVSVTPSSTSSKILVICTIPVGNNIGGQVAMVNLVRGSTTICQPASSQLLSSSKTSYVVNGDIVTNSDLHFLDSPNTTSSTTYKIQIKTNTGTMYVGQRVSGDAATPSTITVMEIKG